MGFVALAFTTDVLLCYLKTGAEIPRCQVTDGVSEKARIVGVEIMDYGKTLKLILDDPEEKNEKDAIITKTLAVYRLPNETL